MIDELCKRHEINQEGVKQDAKDDNLKYEGDTELSVININILC